MGYEDARVNGKIKESDRCCLCGNLCSIDMFLETRCFHLFCAQCFSDYLLRNGHSSEIRDENNYTDLYNPVRCPRSGKILQYKHTKGSLFLKMSQYFSLSRYKIKCEFYVYGCRSELRASKLNEHYLQCFFTSRRLGYDDSIANYNLFQPVDFCANNLYGEMSLRTELIEGIKIAKDGNLMRTKWNRGRKFTQNNLDNVKFEILRFNDSTESKDDESIRYDQIDDYIDLQKNGDELERKRAGSLDFTKDHFSKFKNLASTSNRLSLSSCLLTENEKLKESTLMLLLDEDPKKYFRLTRRLEILQKNVNFIKNQLLPQLGAMEKII